jgi:hypothetical protein
MTRHAAVITRQRGSDSLNDTTTTGETVMDGSKLTVLKRGSGPRRPPEDSFFAAKVDGIMRIAGFVRGEDGSWQKPALAATPVRAAGTVVPADPSAGV